MDTAASQAKIKPGRTDETESRFLQPLPWYAHKLEQPLCPASGFLYTIQLFQARKPGGPRGGSTSVFCRAEYVPIDSRSKRKSPLGIGPPGSGSHDGRSGCPFDRSISYRSRSKSRQVWAIGIIDRE